VSPSMGVIPIGPLSVGKRVSESSAAWQAPRAGHPLQHMISRETRASTAKMPYAAFWWVKRGRYGEAMHL
jgi:hypothetical protein